MNYALQFSGNEALPNQTLDNYNFASEDFTLQCWVKSSQAGTLLSEVDSGLLLSITPDHQLYFSVQNKGITSVNHLAIDDWLHISATCQAGRLSLLLNGAPLLVAEGIRPSNSLSKAGFQIGGVDFQGTFGPVNIWKVALNATQIKAQLRGGTLGQDADLLLHHTFDHQALDSATTPLATSPSPDTQVVQVVEQQVNFTITNDTDDELLCSKKCSEVHFTEFSERIPGKTTQTYAISGDPWTLIDCELEFKNPLGQVNIAIKKTKSAHDSSIISTTPGLDNALMSEVQQKTDQSNENDLLKGEVVVATDLVLINMAHFQEFLYIVTGKGGLKKEQIVTDDQKFGDLYRYNRASQVFNRKFQFRPLAIVYCQSTEDVRLVYTTAQQCNLPIRVRSGGHDHEGECSGTNTIVIDLSQINAVTYTDQAGQPTTSNTGVLAHIGPGIKFGSLTTQLAQRGVMIPHGTCATVGIAGFTFGGGWGPWTRKRGMCCERLVGATIVLGNGQVETLQITDTDPAKKDLLWALKGGGGMSYGIVTELVIETFPLPEFLIKFEISWNPLKLEKGILTLATEATTPTIEVLTAWEKAIGSTETPRLIGTNLKIVGKPRQEPFDAATEVHNCVMYGYWEGDWESLHQFHQEYFASGTLKVTGTGGTQTDHEEPYGANLMSDWDRESFQRVYQLMSGEANHPENSPIPGDLDAPAPHKITSRLVNPEGLQQEGHEALLSSLTSPLIMEENWGLGLFSYVTLGAIVGDFYHQEAHRLSDQSAFPYKDRLYTIQYQTWWNMKLSEQEKEQQNKVYNRTNRALDWMEVARDFEIPHTGGAFISFKDSSIPTETYFQQNYEKLKRIKEAYAQDEFNHFRTRKTII